MTHRYAMRCWDCGETWEQDLPVRHTVGEEISIRCPGECDHMPVVHLTGHIVDSCGCR